MTLLRRLRCLAFVLAASFSAGFGAVTDAKRAFNVPAGAAEVSLKLFSEQSGRGVIFPTDSLSDVRTNAVRGDFTPRDALDQLVARTGLVITPDEKTGAFAIARAEDKPRPPRISATSDATSVAAFSSIEGRVASARTGEYLERARVVLEPSGQETFTTADGHFRFARAPAGNIQLRAFYTGLPVNVSSLALPPGQQVFHNITLGAADPTLDDKRAEIVRLSQFVVATSKEMEGAAIAINEQRFAPNTKTVVATDELGFVPEGNVAEFMKFLPGITIESSGGFAREVSINGVPPANVPITIDGFSLASAHPGGGTGRNAALDMISINNLARVEVAFSPTPETQGSALAGSVNMIPRSSFERSRPSLTTSAYVLMRDNARDFKKTPGPRQNPTRKVHPGFDFIYIRPVNDRFGFTVSAGMSKNYLNQDFIQNTWRGSGTATNGVAFPHTTPDKPYLSATQVSDNTKDSTRGSFSLTVDYKLTPADRLAFSFQYTTTNFANMARSIVFNVNRVNAGDFTTTSTRGVAGAGSLQLTNIGQTRDNRTYMPTLTWRHDGPVWRAEAGVGHSHARGVLRGIDRGFFNTVTAQRTNVTVAFDQIFYLRPGVITVTDGTTGAPVDPYNLSTYAMGTTNGNTLHNRDLQRTAFGNARRDFDGRVPFTLKAGFDVRQWVRDLWARSQPFAFNGRDGRASTTPVGSDDVASPFLDASASQRFAPYGFPQIQWISNEQVWDYYRANPAQFIADENADYRSTISGSKNIEEVVSAVYLRGDVSLLQRRLKLVGGLRAEQTNVDGQGPLTDLGRNNQRDARGNVILGANGRPLTITSVPLEISKLTFLPRAGRAEKEYLRLFPSLNASFNVRENLIARAATYTSVGRPDLNQYGGGLTLPDLELPNSATNRIVVNNAAIKAWSARTTNVRLEYYFEGVGQVSAGAFRREFKNFFGATVFKPTTEFLELYGVEAAYAGYDVATQENLPGTVTMEGIDLAYKQALTFLPRWARGVQVFANGSSQRSKGDLRGNFAGYIPRSGSWGVSLNREKYNLRVNWTYRSRQRRNEVAVGPGVEPGTFNWGLKRLTVDLLGEYQLSRRFALFANLRNVNDATDDFELSGPSTPPHAQFRSRLDFGSLWTFGVKGTF
jgi:iron complex outermembrane receptor protein